MAAIDRDLIFELIAGGPDAGLQPAELALAMGVDRGRSSQIRDILQKMVRSGALLRAGRRYRLAPASPRAELGPSERVEGLLRVSPAGRGSLDRGEAYEAVRIEPGDLRGAIDGDRVVVELAAEDDVGRVVEVVERSRQRVTGVLFGPPWRLEVDDPRLSTVPTEVGDSGPARPADAGKAALAEIVDYPKYSGQPLTLRVTEVLGDPGDLLTEVKKAIGSRGIHEGFSAELERSAPTSLAVDGFADRVDLRDRHFVTIDPLTARDFDDAVAVEPGPAGTTRVWVAVADVSHYVREDSPLDREALARGCSLYLPDRAIPMLPHVLSAGICSLVPHEDRLAMVVRLDIDRHGDVKDSGCVAGVIHSRGQLDYGSVAAVLDGDFRGRRKQYRQHIELLEQLSVVAQTLREARLRRGSLQLELAEAQVKLDEDDPRRVRAVVASKADAPVKRAYNLIEELMIAANEAIGQLFIREDSPTIWRIHPAPRASDLTRLVGWLGSYGVEARAKQLAQPKGMARVLTRIAEHQAQRPLSFLVLRTLKQATYDVKNCGHFGLASQAYLHFTSPIRRYPDLHVHRLVKQLLRRLGEPSGGQAPLRQSEPAQLQSISQRSSRLERRAIEVERQVVSLYSAALMRDRIGDVLEGEVTGVTGFGFFVGLDEPFVDGLVKLETLDDWYEYDGDALRLYGRGGRTVSLGDRISVQVAGANIPRGQVDLQAIGWAEKPRGGQRGRARRPAPRERQRERPVHRRGRRR